MSQDVVAASARAAALPRRRRVDPLPYVLVAPAVVAVLALTVYPAFEAIRLSLTDADLLHYAAARNIGLDNYARAASDPVFLGSIWRTLRYVVVVAAAQLALGLPVALLLHTRFAGRGMLRSAVILPWVVQAAVVSIIWRFMVDPTFGILTDLFRRVGLVREPVAWMSDSIGSFIVLVVASAWAGFPFLAVTLLAVLQAIPEELYEAARVDGATALQRLRYVTWPLLLPTTLLLLLLRTIGLAQGVDLVFIMTAGGPSYHNYTLSLYSLVLTWRTFQIGYASALTLLLAVVLIGASAVYVRLIQRAREWA